MTTPHNMNEKLDHLAEELDLLAFPIITGTLKVRPPAPTQGRAPHIGDYILNVRPRKGTANEHTVLHGRITAINSRGCAYDGDRYLGRVNGSLGWVTSIVEPHQILPRMHNSLIVITRLAGHTVEIPAIYDTTRQAWQTIREGSTINDRVWIQPNEIQDFRHAKVVTL